MKILNHKHLFDQGQEQLAEKIKILIYKSSNKYKEIIDFSNNSIFLEPLLFAYFNGSNKGMTLDQILWGYLDKDKRLQQIDIITSKEGIALIPNLGYFLTTARNKTIKLNYSEKEGIKLYDEDMLIYYGFRKIEFIGNKKLSILSYSNSMIDEWMTVFNVSEQFNKRERIIADFDIAKSAHGKEAQKALEIINKVHPDFYNEIIRANSLICLYDNPRGASFVHPGFHGATFYTLVPYNGVAFFIDEFIHQFTHSYYNAVFYEKTSFFKIDVDNIRMKDIVPKSSPEDIRDIFGIFHGLLTVGMRVSLYPKILESGLLKGQELHELHGRFADLYRRFHTGLQHLDLDEVFEREAKDIYLEFDRSTKNGLEEMKSILSKYKTDNQKTEFDYKLFLDLNPYNTNI